MALIFKGLLYALKLHLSNLGNSSTAIPISSHQGQFFGVYKMTADSSEQIPPVWVSREGGGEDCRRGIRQKGELPVTTEEMDSGSPWLASQRNPMTLKNSKLAQGPGTGGEGFGPLLPPLLLQCRILE